MQKKEWWFDFLKRDDGKRDEKPSPFFIDIRDLNQGQDADADRDNPPKAALEIGIKFTF